MVVGSDVCLDGARIISEPRTSADLLGSYVLFVF